MDGEHIEVVDQFNFLGVMLTKDDKTTVEIWRRTIMAKEAMMGLDKIWKDRSISKTTKVRLTKVLVFQIAQYGAETWCLNVNDRRKIDAFEMWC